MTLIKKLDHEKRRLFNTLGAVLRDGSDRDFQFYSRTYVRAMADFMVEGFDVSKPMKDYKNYVQERYGR